jgi:PAS domain S-box-containing protein
MPQRKPLLPKIPAAIHRYIVALLSVAVALGADLLLERLRLRNISLFLLAITIAAWYGGTGAAMLALLVTCLGFHFVFVEPFHSLYITASEPPYFIFFASFASLVSWFSAARRRVERELLQSREELAKEVVVRTQQASLLNLTHDTIFVRDMGDLINYWNRGALELYGWTAEEAIGKHAHQLLRTVFPAPIDEIQAELLRTGRWEGELEKTKSDGTPMVVASRWSLRRNEQEGPIAILETNNDITQRKRGEEEIRQLNRELGKRTIELDAMNKELEAFAYSTSHDLRPASPYGRLYRATAKERT